MLASIPGNQTLFPTHATTTFTFTETEQDAGPAGPTKRRKSRTASACKKAPISYVVSSYLSTCRKNNVPATRALTLLFESKLMDFILQQGLKAGFWF